MLYNFLFKALFVISMIFGLFALSYYAYANEYLPEPMPEYLQQTLKYEDQVVNREAKEDSLLYYRKTPHLYPSHSEKYKTDKWESPEGWVVFYDTRDGGQCYIKHTRYDIMVTDRVINFNVEGTHWNPRMETFAFLKADRSVGILLTADIMIGNTGEDFTFYGLIFDPLVRRQYFQEYSYLQFNEHVIDLAGSKDAWQALVRCLNDK